MRADDQNPDAGTAEAKDYETVIHGLQVLAMYQTVVQTDENKKVRACTRSENLFFESLEKRFTV